MKKIYLIGIVLLFLFAVTVSAETLWNDSFEDNSCSDWTGCVIESTTVFNGSYSGKGSGTTMDYTYGAVNQNYNITFWGYLSAPVGADYKSIIATTGGGLDNWTNSIL